MHIPWAILAAVAVLSTIANHFFQKTKGHVTEWGYDGF